jgi:hypothetical protein
MLLMFPPAAAPPVGVVGCFGNLFSIFPHQLGFHFS